MKFHTNLFFLVSILMFFSCSNGESNSSAIEKVCNNFFSIISTEDAQLLNKDFAGNDATKVEMKKYLIRIKDKFQKQKLMGWGNIKAKGYYKSEGSPGFDIIGVDMRGVYFEFHNLISLERDGETFYLIGNDDLYRIGENKEDVIKKYEKQNGELIWF